MITRGWCQVNTYCGASFCMYHHLKPGSPKRYIGPHPVKISTGCLPLEIEISVEAQAIMISVHHHGKVLDRHEINQGDNFGTEVRKIMAEKCGYREPDN